MSLAYHKNTKVSWVLMTRAGIINTERGDIHYSKGDVMVRRDGSRDQWPVSPATFIASYNVEEGGDLDYARKFWDEHNIPY